MLWWRSSREKSMINFLTVRFVILKKYIFLSNIRQYFETIHMHASLGFKTIILISSISFARVLY